MTGSDDRKWCLEYRVEAKCSTTKARAGQISLAHGNVSTPVFMPVGTQGTMKGISVEQLKFMNFEIILANTYHESWSMMVLPSCS